MEFILGHFTDNHLKIKPMTMKTTLLRILLLLSLTPIHGFAQQKAAEDFLLDRMTGKWVLQGTIEGKETIHDVKTEWVLNRQYLQLKEVSREKNPNGEPVYEALVYISVNDSTKEYTCLWLDNTGSSGLNAMSMGHAKAKGDILEFLFKGSDNSIFHTAFIYDKNSDSWQWIMNGEMNGKLQPFAKLKLTRSN